MKPSRFTEEQIIGILRSRSRAIDVRCVPQARDQQRNLLQMEGQIRWPRCIGREAAKVAGRRERQAEEAFGRGHARQRDVEEYRSKKMVTPAARREAVAHLRVAYEVSEQRACVRHSEPTAHRSATAAVGRTMRWCGRGYANWLPFAGGSAIGGCTSCLHAKGIVMNHKKLRRLVSARITYSTFFATFRFARLLLE